MNIEQLVLNFGYKEMMGREQFFRSDSNEMALSIIEKYNEWPRNKLILVGPKGCGKSHISSMLGDELDTKIYYAKDFNLPQVSNSVKKSLVIIEDLHELQKLNNFKRKEIEEALFHLLIKIENSDTRIFITGCKNPIDWQIKLPDLSSRLHTFALAKIENPDDRLFLSLILKFFSDKQLSASPAVINFIAARIDRTYLEARKFVDLVDQRALKDKREISLKLVRSVLENYV